MYTHIITLHIIPYHFITWINYHYTPLSINPYIYKTLILNSRVRVRARTRRGLFINKNWAFCGLLAGFPSGALHFARL